VSTVLAVLTPARRGDALIHEAIRVCQMDEKEVQLHVIYIIDQRRGEHLKDCLNNRGFVGPAPAEDVGRISNDTAQMAGQQALQDAMTIAEEHSVQCHTEVIWGEVLETVIETAHACQASHVLMSQSRLGPLVRLFGEKGLTKLKRRLGDRLVTVPSQGDGS
jgi:hypothetical protein